MREIATVLVCFLVLTAEAVACTFTIPASELRDGDSATAVILGEVMLIGPSLSRDAREMRVRTIRTYLGEDLPEWRIAVRARRAVNTATMPGGFSGKYWFVLHPPGTRFQTPEEELGFTGGSPRLRAPEPEPIPSRQDGYLFEINRFGLCGGKGVLRFDPAIEDAVEARLGSPQ